MSRAAVHVRRWKPLKKRLLSREQVERIMALPWARGSGRALAREMGISCTLVSLIRNGLRYKRERPQETYYVRLTDGNERYSLGSFLTPEAAQNAADKFQRTNKWPRGSVSREKGRYRARLSLGVYDTRWAADLACQKALEKLQE